MDTLDKDFYEDYGRQWHSTERRQIERIDTYHKIETLRELLGDIRPRSILDIGSGLGDAIDFMAKAYDPDVAVGADVSSTMIEFARKEHPKYRFIHGGIDAVEDMRVDLITFLDVLEHLEDIPATLGAAKKCASYIGIKIPLEKTWLISLLNALHLKERRSRAFESEGHLYEFNRADVDAILEDAGLTIVGSKVAGTMPKEILFIPEIERRMKAKGGLLGKVKYLVYKTLKYVPFRVTDALLAVYLGYDYSVVCRTPLASAKGTDT